MSRDKINNNNKPDGAMDSKEKVHSNDRKMKQDFPGYPHNPASEDAMDGSMNWRTDFSNESNTTATGTESVRGDRPSEQQNEIDDREKDFLSQNDRGMIKHQSGSGDVENNNAKYE